MSGYVDSDGTLCYEDSYGYLCSASPVNTNNTRAFKFNKDKGKLNNNYNRNNARPCLFVVEHSLLADLHRSAFTIITIYGRYRPTLA